MLSSNLYSVQLPRCGDFIGFSVKSQGHPDTRLQVELCNLGIVCILMMPGQLWRLSELPRCKHPWIASKRCLRHSQDNKSSNLPEETKLSGGLGRIPEGFRLFLSGALRRWNTSVNILKPTKGIRCSWQRRQWSIRGNMVGLGKRPGSCQLPLFP